MRTRNLLLICTFLAILPGCSRETRNEGKVAGPEETQNTPPTRIAPRPANREPTGELLRLQEEFLSTIASGKPDRFLEYLAGDGVYIGVDGPRMSAQDIQDEIRSHRCVYCLLFDTVCLRQETHNSSICSYKELLSSPTQRNAHTSARVFERKEQAEIIVDVRNTRCDKTETLNFVFNKQASQWKLVAIPYT